MKLLISMTALLLLNCAMRAAQNRDNSITVSTRDELTRAVQNATPGAKVLIAPGTYRGGLTFTGLSGAKGKPIVLAASDPKRPPVFKGGACVGSLGRSSISPARGETVIELLVLASI